MWIMGISQNYGIFKVEGSCFIATLNKLTTKTTSWQCHCTGCVPAQTLNLLTCTVYWARHKPLAEEEEYLVRNVLEEIVVDGLCIYVHVVWTISLCVSESLCFPPVLSWYRRPTELSVSGSKSRRESGKLPLALSQHGDFPLLQLHVSVWLLPKQNIKSKTPIPTAALSITAPIVKHQLVAPDSFPKKNVYYKQY